MLESCHWKGGIYVLVGIWATHVFLKMAPLIDLCSVLYINIIYFQKARKQVLKSIL